MNFNAHTFLTKLAKKMRSDVDYAYPHSTYESSRGHTTLQMLNSKVEALEAFLQSIEFNEEPITFPPIGDEA